MGSFSGSNQNVLQNRAADAEMPTAEQARAERDRLKQNYRIQKTVFSTVGILLVAAAVISLIVTATMPMLRVTGSSMEPTVSPGSIVVLLETRNLKSGDVVGFYYQNKVILRRVVGVSGDTVDIASDGSVFVNGKLLDEPYVSEKISGECGVEFPCQVPEGTWFVLCDNREVSNDSRSAAMGCIADDRIIGKVIFVI